ncbi:hypothetical protein CDAR_366881 [Caerostris darwini]|uniref:Uncharacterized protein n=1 Tax=Caerostris darwini TaxID=1538125 RepID=A0AAV4N6L2_9ARAC|nr:hypothetical protein CDAR_366881 [Caerostris darwini]
MSRSEIPPAPIRKGLGKKYHQGSNFLHPEEYSPEKLRSKWQLSTSTLRKIQVLHKERRNVCFASSLSRIGWNGRMFRISVASYSSFFPHPCCYAQKNAK